MDFTRNPLNIAAGPFRRTSSDIPQYAGSPGSPDDAGSDFLARLRAGLQGLPVQRGSAILEVLKNPSSSELMQISQEALSEAGVPLRVYGLNPITVAAPGAGTSTNSSVPPMRAAGLFFSERGAGSFLDRITAITVNGNNLTLGSAGITSYPFETQPGRQGMLLMIGAVLNSITITGDMNAAGSTDCTLVGISEQWGQWALQSFAQSANWS